MTWLRANLATAAAAILLGLLLIQTVRLHVADRARERAQAALSIERGHWESERAAAAANLAAAHAHARSVEQDLSERATEIQEQAHAQITVLSDRAADLSRRLRIASEAAAANVSRAATAAGARAAEPGPAGALPAGRPGDDLDALIQLAERGDTIRLHLAACRKQYKAARQGIEAMTQP